MSDELAFCLLIGICGLMLMAFAIAVPFIVYH